MCTTSQLLIIGGFTLRSVARFARSFTISPQMILLCMHMIRCDVHHTPHLVVSAAKNHKPLKQRRGAKRRAFAHYGLALWDPFGVRSTRRQGAGRSSSRSSTRLLRAFGPMVAAASVLGSKVKIASLTAARS